MDCSKALAATVDGENTKIESLDVEQFKKHRDVLHATASDVYQFSFPSDTDIDFE